MIRLLIAFQDGTEIDEEFPNHELEDIQLMVRETEDELLVRVEIEDSKQNILYQYRRKTHYAY